jgi:hypothetical protein
MLDAIGNRVACAFCEQLGTLNEINDLLGVGENAMVRRSSFARSQAENRFWG